MKQKKVKVNGIEFTLQNPGYRWYLDTVEKNTPPNKNRASQSAMYDDYLEHVVVQPENLTIEDFEDESKKLGGIKTLRKLVLDECEPFLNPAG